MDKIKARMQALILGLLAVASATVESSPVAPLYDVVAFDEVSLHPEIYLTGKRALVIKGAALGWDAMARMSPEYLLRKFAHLNDSNIADWYPDSMTTHDVHPYLVVADNGFQRIREAAEQHRAAYLQWRLPLAQAELLLADMQPMPGFLQTSWMEACLPEPAHRNNLMMTVAWNMLVVGVEGGGMFLHPDNYDSGTWQIQLVGTKDWTLCDPGRVRANETLYAAGAVDSFHGLFAGGADDDGGRVLFDAARFPRFAISACARIRAHPGDLIIYPSRWWHQTRVPRQQQPAAPRAGSRAPPHPNRAISIGMASRWVNHVNYGEVAAAVQAKCDSGQPDASLTWKGAAPNPLPAVCERVRTHCVRAWRRAFEQPAQTPPPTAGGSLGSR